MPGFSIRLSLLLDAYHAAIFDTLSFFFSRIFTYRHNGHRALRCRCLFRLQAADAVFAMFFTPPFTSPIAPYAIFAACRRYALPCHFFR